MPETILEISNLTKFYKSINGPPEKLALNNVSLAIPRGSFFALLGPNGAGKSTIINILAGTVKKSSGKIFFAGQDFDVQEMDIKRKIGIVPQELIIDTFFKVREGLELYAGYFGIRPKDRKTDQILEAIGLLDKSNAMVKTLSGGMKRRYLVAKALVNSPELVILDEPTAGVDVQLRMQLWEYIKKLNQQGTTIILTTHYLQEAQELCDRVAFIDNGEIVAVDSKKGLLKSYDKRKLVIEFESMPEVLPKLDSQCTIVQHENKIEIEFKSSKLNDVLAAIAEIKAPIQEIFTEHVDIEEVFKQIIFKGKK